MPEKFGYIDDGPKGPSGSEIGDSKSAGTSPRTLPIIELPTIDAGPGDGTDYSEPNPIDAEQPKRRGRPPGSTNYNRKARTEAKANLIPDLEGLLFSANTMMAALLSAPDWAIDQNEAKYIADAAKEVAKHYAYTVDPKKMAWANFWAAVGTVYGPRIVVAWKKQPETKVETGPGKTVPIDSKPQPKGEKPKTKQWNELTPSEIFGESPATSDTGL